MKKLLSLCLLVMALGMFTIGCSGASDTPAPSDTPAAGGTDDAGAPADEGAADEGGEEAAE